MFDYEELSLENTCLDCEENEKTTRGIVYWFDVLLESIYSKESLDEIEFEDCLDEIACHLNMKLPEEKMNLVRKEYSNKNMNQVLDIWKTENKEYLKILA